MHDLHKEGATREQIEHALVTLPYVCIRLLTIQLHGDQLYSTLR